MTAPPARSGKQDEARAVTDLLRKGRNYRELRLDHQMRKGRGDFHDHPNAQAGFHNIQIAIDRWRKTWKARMKLQGREVHSTPAAGPWQSECSGPYRMEETRNVRYLRACLEYAWARENKWDSNAAQKRVQVTACRLPTLKAATEARDRRKMAPETGTKTAAGTPRRNGETNDTKPAAGN